MDYQLIKEFLTTHDLKEFTKHDWPLVEMEHKSLEGAPEISWELLTGVLAAKDAGLLKFVEILVASSSSMRGAAGLVLSFIWSLNDLDSKVSQQVGLRADSEGWSEMSLSLADMTLIKKYITQFKMALSEKVEGSGGVTKIAELADLTQPQLSRMLNDDSVPRMRTLQKLFMALNINKIKIKIKEGRED